MTVMTNGARAGILRVEWLNRNASIAFPFDEDSDFSISGGGSVPLSAIVDARAVILDSDPGRMRLASMSVSDDGGEIAAKFVGSADRRVWIVVGCPGERSVVRDGRSSVMVSFGEFGGLGLAPGEHVLSRPPALLRSRVVVIPSGIGVDTLSCGSNASRATGDVVVERGYNTELSVVGGKLRLDIGNGLGLGMPCDPATPTGLPNSAGLMYYLNGVKADSDGSVGIFAGTGVSVSSGSYGGIPAVVVRTSPVVDSMVYGE